MKKKGRGCSEEVVSSDGIVTCVKWFDNKCVALASNYVGIGKPDKAQRFDKTADKQISIDHPQIVQEYNLNMGGVDLMNQMISYYRITIRSRKWTLRMITHFVDFAIVQSWIEYKIDCDQSGIPKRKVMDLLAFRMQLTNELVYSTAVVKRTGGRINLDDIRSNRNNFEKSREHRTPESIRYDKHDHFPEYSTKRLKCKLESCKMQSHCFCTKCNVHLCFNKNNNCFAKYHS